jgi:putative oligomerization/nucleic acid binding protein
MMGGRRVARRTARRTSRRQMAMMQDSGGGYDDGGYEQAPAAPAAPAAPDYADELQKLAELKAAGIINDEEFEAKKKQILGL